MIDDTPRLGIKEFEERARQYKQEKKVELIILDSLQLLQAGSERGMDDYVSKSVKMLARELEIPIIVTAELTSAKTFSPPSKKSLSAWKRPSTLCPLRPSAISG